MSRHVGNIAIMVWSTSILAAFAHGQEPRPRARDLGIPFDGTPGALNAITDVNGVEVGHTTLIAGEGKLEVGKGPVRTGVTAILPRGKDSTEPVFAGWFSLNGNGEMTGHALDRGVRLPRRAGHDHQHAQRRRGARRRHRLSGQTGHGRPVRHAVVVAGRRRDL